MENKNELTINEFNHGLNSLTDKSPLGKMLFSPERIWYAPDSTKKFKFYRDTGEEILDYTHEMPTTLLDTTIFPSFESFQQYRIDTFQKMISLIERTKRGEIWEPSASNVLEDVTFTIEYPNGKNGDINMFISETYGLIEKIGPTTYRVVMSSEHKDKLVLLRSNYVYSFPVDHTDELFRFLKNNNIYYKLRAMLDDGDIRRARYYNSRDISQFIIDIIDIYIKNIRRKRNEIHKNLLEVGVTSPRWVCEFRLYQIVNSLFPDAIYQYRFNQLGRQSLDVFIPSLCVGLEYQGIQHYEPVGLFGGEEGLKNRIELDKKKRLLCKENGITLIEQRYDEPLDVEYIQSKIMRYLDNETNE